MKAPMTLVPPKSPSPCSNGSGAVFLPATAEAPPAPRRRFNPWCLFVGAMVPNWLLLRPEVSSGAKLCYARLAQHAGKNNRCCPRQGTLAAELAVSPRTANEYLRELRRHGLLEWEQPGLGRANRYFFLDHPWIHEGPALRAASGPDSQDSSGQDAQTSSAPIDEENQEERESKRRGTQTKASQACLIPSSEAEAVRTAALDGVPAEFARTVFNHMEGIGWLDGSKRPVRNWQPYLKARWSREQEERTERASHRSPRRTTNAPAQGSAEIVKPGCYTNYIGKL